MIYVVNSLSCCGDKHKGKAMTTDPRFLGTNCPLCGKDIVGWFDKGSVTAMGQEEYLIYMLERIYEMGERV